MTGRMTIHIQGQRFDALDDIWNDHARNVVQILDARNEAVDRIKREKLIGFCVGILGVFIAIAFAAYP